VRHSSANCAAISDAMRDFSASVGTVSPPFGVTTGLAIYCRGKIASFKIPRHVLVIEDFPWTGSGKIQKVKLREHALRRLRAAGGARDQG
jgi:acyl-CoA synthetase (AMP-forming)/AMP-acid ligase II